MSTIERRSRLLVRRHLLEPPQHCRFVYTREPHPLEYPLKRIRSVEVSDTRGKITGFQLRKILEEQPALLARLLRSGLALEDAEQLTRTGDLLRERRQYPLTEKLLLLWPSLVEGNGDVLVPCYAPLATGEDYLRWKSLRESFGSHFVIPYLEDLPEPQA